MLTVIYSTEPSSEDSKPVTLQQALDIPRRPRKPAEYPSEDVAMTNGTSGPGKRKRDDEEMTNGHVTKKLAGDQPNGDGEDVIVLDEQDGGTILID